MPPATTTNTMNADQRMWKASGGVMVTLSM